MFNKSASRGFTLLEILLVVGIIAILAGIVIIAINPNKQLATTRNAQRLSDLKQINSALVQYYIDHNSYPASSTVSINSYAEVCNTGDVSGTTTSVTGASCGNLANLSDLVPTYLVAIPADPQGSISTISLLNKVISTAFAATRGTGYQILVNSNNKIILTAPQAEYNMVVAVGTTTVSLPVAAQAPGAPTIGSATAGNATSTVTFSAPAYDGGYTITSYEVTSNPGSITATGASSPITITGLTNGTAYTFTVKAINASGMSSSSVASNSVTPADPIIAGLRSGLVAYYPLDGDVNDNVGIKNGTWTGTPGYVAGKNGLGQAISLGGTNYITFSDANLPSGHSNFTVNFWFKDSGGNSWYNGIFDYGTAGVAGRSLSFYSGQPRAYFTYIPFCMDTYGNGLAYGANLHDGVWHSFTGTYDGTYIKMYIDGSYSGVKGIFGATLPSGFAVNTNIILDGTANIGGAGAGFIGQVDELAVWNRTLNATEISQLYNSNSGRSLVQ